MEFFLAISIAAIGGCLVGIFGTSVYYNYFAKEEYWDDDGEDIWK